MPMFQQPGLDPASRLIVALDFPTAEAALALVDRMEGSCRWFKVGLELYLAAGNTVTEQLRKRGYSVFLDLKLHDIPNTVAGAIRTAADSGASLLTVHATGGPAMLAAAADAVTGLPSAPKLLAVTVLTSMDSEQLAAIGVKSSPAEEVLGLAAMAESAGISGFVCSPEETALLRGRLAPESLLVVPGIRPVGSATDDQKRIATPATALAAGASMLVVGRPITQAADPRAAAVAILAEMAPAL